MKRSKLLFAPIIATCAFAPVALVTSCNQKTEAELVAEAIYSPLDLQKTTLEGSYIDKLKTFNAEEKKACLIYDLFGFFNIKGWRNLPNDESFTSLYKKDKVSIATVVSSCDYTILANNKVKINMLGYVSFIFNDNFKVSGETGYRYSKNDYVMITYDIQNREVQIDETNLCIKYERIDTTEQSTECLGTIKEKRGGDEARSILYYIKNINVDKTYSQYDLPNNFKNLVK